MNLGCSARGSTQGHASLVLSVPPIIFDESGIAVPSCDTTVDIWDGEELKGLRGCTSLFHLVSFSPGESTLVLAHNDETVPT
ncbi:uncharacterized protein EI90DRAFT_3053539 [Cantharellus anzutake]|uniref:uncharacterized protein n=1 Tax=Cantharellus anzutake TaxID=1750568 RepID=UPI001905369F|nr:uncharacterized protein EI90DRAFT_3053539 [Cantharellus anzutake]KAF8333239.1 hypothetical protein EI90DRAFT_3053539 [Cantharellus anzutake]